MAPKVKYPYKGNVRWAFMRWADIPDANNPEEVYLRRLRILQTPLFAIYLHFIYVTDNDRDPHDHPCNFWSLVVRGWYREIVWNGKGRTVQEAFIHSPAINTHRRGSVHSMPVTSAHQITDIGDPLVTLCVFGRRQRGWGFWTADGFIDQNTYRRAKGEKVDEFS